MCLSRHAKRTTVSTEDVKLCCRRSQSLLDIITARGDKIRAEKDGGGGGASTDKEGGGRCEERGVAEKERQPPTDKKSRRTNRNKT